MNQTPHWTKRLALISVLVISTLMIMISSIASLAFVASGSYIKTDNEIKQTVLDYTLSQEIGEFYNYLYNGFIESEDQKAQIESYFTDNYTDTNVIVRVTNAGELVFGLHEEESNFLRTRNYNYIISDEEGNQIEFNIMNPMRYEDRFDKLVKITGTALMFKFWVYPVLIVSIIAFLFSLAIIRKNKRVKEHSKLDIIPLDLFLMLLLFVFILFDGFYYEVMLLIMYLGISSLIILSMVNRRYKNGTLISNNISIRFLSKLSNILKRALRNTNLLMKVSLAFGTLGVVQIITVLTFMYEPFLILFILLPVDVVMAYLVLKHFLDLEDVEKGSFEVASGNLDFDFKDASFLGLLDPISRNLSQVSNATKYAVQKEMASERMKTELITNVSHDIKTPITSIINYVDLLNNTEDLNEVKEYTEVLTRQSLRLKNLVEDLIDASKLSTGNVELQRTELDLNMLLDQAIGEVSEMFEEKGLSIVLTREETPLMIEADGNQLSRLFDNILYNTYQYSLENTRVYLDVIRNGKIQITVRNISKEALNVDAESLVERFTRADSSRNTEGSGLGLSIAKSIVELHDGTFNLEIDGDLFKVIIEL